MAEGDASWHDFVTAKRVDGGTKSGDMEAVTNDDNLAINKAKLGGSDAGSEEFCFVAKRDVPIRTRAIRYKRGIFIERDICGASVRTHGLSTNPKE